MAEQDVRPQQLSIRDIARLWCAETGEKASELEDELSNWAYAETVDRGPLGSDPDAAPGASAALKVEPDPTRKLSWNDLESFCKDQDRLIPSFWPEPAREASDSGPPATPSEPRRLVIEAMTRLESLSENAAAERRLQGPAPARRKARAKPTPAVDATNGTETDVDRPAEPVAADSAGEIPAEPAIQRPEMVTVWPAPESLKETAIQAPVAPGPAGPVSRREAKPRRAGLMGGIALGAALTVTLAVAGGALWIEYKGPGLMSVIGQDAGNGAALAAAEERLAAASAQAQEAEQQVARLDGQLAEARREADTLRAETPDVAALTQRLDAALARSTELSAALDAMRADGSDSQRAFLDQLGTARQDATRLAAEAQANRLEAERLTQELATARTAVETVEAARDQALEDRQGIAGQLAAVQQQLADLTETAAAADAEAQGRIADLSDAQATAEANARRLDADLAKSRDEVENLTHTAAAAQAVIQRLSDDLHAARANVAAAATEKQDAEGKAVALDRDLTAARAQLVSLRAASAAAEGEVRRLGAELDGARREASELRAAVEGSTGEAKKLANQMETARREATAASVAKTDAKAEVADLSAKLAKSNEESAAARTAAEQANAEAARLNAELAEATRAVAKVEERLTASEVRAKSATAELIQARRQIDDFRTAMARTEAEKRSGLSAADSWKMKADDLASALEQATQRLVRLTAQNAALTAAGGTEKEALIGTAPAAPAVSGKLAAATGAPQLPAAAPPASNQPAAKMAFETRSGASPSLLARGDEYFGRGDIASARLFYEQAADLGDAAAFTAIGKTYDPAILRRQGILGAFASAKQAIEWYKRGADAGDAEARRRLAELQAKLNQ